MRHGQTEPGPPSIVSTVKINQAGFTEMMDTEAMFRKWFRQARRTGCCLSDSLCYDCRRAQCAVTSKDYERVNRPSAFARCSTNTAEEVSRRTQARNAIRPPKQKQCK